MSSQTNVQMPHYDFHLHHITDGWLLQTSRPNVRRFERFDASELLLAKNANFWNLIDPLVSYRLAWQGRAFHVGKHVKISLMPFTNFLVSCNHSRYATDNVFEFDKTRLFGVGFASWISRWKLHLIEATLKIRPAENFGCPCCYKHFCIYYICITTLERPERTEPIDGYRSNIMPTLLRVQQFTIELKNWERLAATQKLIVYSP